MDEKPEIEDVEGTKFKAFKGIATKEQDYLPTLKPVEELEEELARLN